jgi:hypothetical protein
VSKIFILSQSQVLPTLTEFIEPANIPKKYGGELAFEFGDMPAIEPALLDELTWGAGAGAQRDQPTIPTGPVRWEEDPATGHMVAWAVGTEGGQPRRRVVATLKRSFRETMHPTKQPTAEDEEDDEAEFEDAAEAPEEPEKVEEAPAEKEANGAVPNGSADVKPPTDELAKIALDEKAVVTETKVDEATKAAAA